MQISRLGRVAGYAVPAEGGNYWFYGPPESLEAYIVCLLLYCFRTNLCLGGYVAEKY